MNLKINKNYIYIVIFTSFFFFWGNLNDLFRLIHPPFTDLTLTSLIYIKLKYSYLIIILLIPIFYSLIKKKNFYPREIFNNQKYIIFFILFVFAHYVFIKFYYNEIFAKTEIVNLIYLSLLSIIYCHYRNFILINFKKIIIFYSIILIFYSIYEGAKIYNFGFYAEFDPVLQFINTGQCNNDLFLIDVIKKYTGISFSNSIYLENSHLALMSIPVFFSCIYIAVQQKKNNILFLSLLLIQIIIVLTNLSTTYFVCYFVAQITLLFFFLKKINIKFWIFTILLLSINSYLFLSDKNCTVKVTDFNVKEVLNKDLERKTTNLTTLIYKRSAILTLDTLKDHSFGWGIDGMDDATQNLMAGYNYNGSCVGTQRRYQIDDLNNSNILTEQKRLLITLKEKYINNLDEQYTYMLDENNLKYRLRCSDDEYEKWYQLNPKLTLPQLNLLNFKDGLSNLFKMFTEFGIFTFIIFYFFLRYILNIKNLSSYNLFIIVLFVSMCIRGVGYFNGGFIFCLLEFFYCKKSFNASKNY